MKTKITQGIFIFATSMLLLLLSVQAISNSFYFSLHIGQYDSHQLVTWDHQYALQEISAYLNGQRETLEFPSTPGGTDVVMSERGLFHMEDVAVLYEQGRILAALFTVIAVISGITLYDKKNLKQTLQKVWIFPVTLTAFLTVAMLIDFGAAFRLFHEVLFDNDLWILSATDPLIVMLPRTFFFLTGLTIAVIYILLVGGLTLIGYRTKKEF
jgi:integral membrane protein TIGR01906